MNLEAMLRALQSTVAAILQRVQALESQSKVTKKSADTKVSTGGIVFIEPVSLQSGTSTAAWSPLSASAYVPAGVKALYVTCRLKTPVLAAYADFTIDVRQTSSDQTRNILTVGAVNPEQNRGSANALIPCSDAATFDYQVTSSTAAVPASWDIKLEGYIL